MPIQLTVSGQSLEAEKPTGFGATSVVWRCRHRQTGALCALKVARRAGDQAILADEAERLFWGMSPSLPQLVAVGRVSGSALGDDVMPDAPCLVLEWIDGVTLREYATTHRQLDESSLYGILRDIANALSDLHAAGIAHGDLKPENVMLVERAGRMRAVLIDLGLSAAADSSMPRGATRHYLAPEVLGTSLLGDGRTRDLWALGRMAAELVDPATAEVAPEQLFQLKSGWGPIGDLVGPLLSLCPGARPPASWVSLVASARLPNARGNQGHAAQSVEHQETVAFRRARVRRAYLSVRRGELTAAARSRDLTLEIHGIAKNWVETGIAVLASLDSIRGIRRHEQPVVLGNLKPTEQLKFLVELVGTIAVNWPSEATLGDDELLTRLLAAVEHLEPHALTPKSIANSTAHSEQVGENSLLELALHLVDGVPGRDVIDRAEAASQCGAVPSAFRLALGRRLRLCGEYARALAVLDRDGAAECRAEAAETARRLGDFDGALGRIRSMPEPIDGWAKARAAATEGRILLEQQGAAAAIARVSGVAESAPVLEVRALGEIRLMQHAAAFETLERARALATGDEEQSRISATLGMLQHATGAAPVAVGAFRRAVEYAVRAGAVLEEATYLTGLAAAAVDSGQLDEAIGASERATLLFDVIGHPSRAARAALNRVAALAAAGARLQAEAAAAVALAFARAVKDDRCSANIHLALVDASEGAGDAREHAERAAALLSAPTTDEQLIVAARCHDCDQVVDVAACDRLARQIPVSSVAALDWWGARARHALSKGQSRDAEVIVGEVIRLLDAPASVAGAGRTFAAAAHLARLAQLGDAARRLHVAAAECLRRLVSGCSAELRTSLMTQSWVKSLRAPDTSLLLPEQVADIESLVRSLGHSEQLRPLLVQVLDALVLWTGVERGLMLLSAPGGRLQPRVGRNIGRSDLVGHQLELSNSLASRALEQGEPIVAVDASGELDSIHASVHALKLRSVLAVPLLARGEALGVVYLDDRIRRGAFGDKELAWVRLVAAVAAVAISDARDRLRLRRAARRAERAERQMGELLAVREAELGEVRVELARSREAVPTRYRYDGIVGDSQAMQDLLRLVDRVVAADVPVMVLGESGTGKELIARAIHQNGPRSRATFVAENCGAIPESLLESALFGHVKGAFTGAGRSRAGLFEVAHQGTLFLDEIAEMSLGMQTKLLRVLEEGEFWPVGSERSRHADVRVIAATNRDLGAMVAAGTFRQDLFYRLNVVTLRVPPLRERHGDVPALVRHFLRRYAGDRAIVLDQQALELLGRYPWPGNVRQLENEIRRAIVLAEDTISVEQLSDEVRTVALETRPRPEGLDLRSHLDALERDLVTKALERTGGNQTRTAELLGLSRFGLQKMMRRLEIRSSDSVHPPPATRPTPSRPSSPKPTGKLA